MIHCSAQYSSILIFMELRMYGFLNLCDVLLTSHDAYYSNVHGLHSKDVKKCFSFVLLLKKRRHKKLNENSFNGSPHSETDVV